MIYFIEDEHKQYIIYHPLKQIAFAGNEAMVHLIQNILENKKDISQLNNETRDFFESLDFFSPAQIHCDTQPCDLKPSTAVLCLTNQCNFDCIYCYSNEENNLRKPLSYDAGIKVIDKASENAANQDLDSFDVQFHGSGEPLIEFDLLKRLTAYSRAKEIGVNILLTSNGNWKPTQRAWILENIDHVSLSFDGVQHVQDFQRPRKDGSGSFKTVFENLKLMDQHNMSYGIRMTVTDYALDYLVESIAFLIENTKCSTFQIEPAFSTGKAKTFNTALTLYDQFVQKVITCVDLAESNNRLFYYSGARLHILTEMFCKAPLNALIVTPENDLTLCYEVSGKSHPLFKSFYCGSLDEKVLIIKEKVNEFLCKIEERKSKCRKCFCYYHCAGDCPAKVIGENELSHLEFGIRCSVNQKIILQLIKRKIFRHNGVWKG